MRLPEQFLECFPKNQTELLIYFFLNKAGKVGPTTDPDKAFNSATKGVVLGIAYDTVAWTWSIPLDKLARSSQQHLDMECPKVALPSTKCGP